MARPPEIFVYKVVFTATRGLVPSIRGDVPRRDNVLTIDYMLLAQRYLSDLTGESLLYIPCGSKMRNDRSKGKSVVKKRIDLLIDVD